MPGRLAKRRRWVVPGCLILTASIALFLISQRHSSARRQWKDQAIVRIEQRLSDHQWLDGEVARLKAATWGRPLQGAWVGDELLLTRNGDWLICQSVAAKEQKTSVTKDLFIGRGSDGKWYYSTFHFCIGKDVLHTEPQPDSLAQLVNAYWLVPFDGKSDECLKTTWDGGPYGQSKLQAAASTPQ
jgi:hypothetical protein